MRKAPSFDTSDLQLRLRSYDAQRAGPGVILVLSALGLLVLAILLKAVL